MEEEKGNSLLPMVFATFQGYVPDPIVPPRYGDPAKQEELNCNDVLSGNGRKKFMHYQGNINFRKIVSQNQQAYVDATFRVERQHIAAKIVATVRFMNPPGRFLMKSEETGHWEEIGDKIAREKVRQALRDGKRKLKWVNKQRSNIATASLQESSVMSREKGFNSSDQNPNITHRKKSTLTSNNRERPLKLVEASRKRMSTDLNMVLGRNNIMPNAETEYKSDLIPDDLQLDMYRIKDFMSYLPAHDSPYNSRTFNKRLTPETLFGYEEQNSMTEHQQQQKQQHGEITFHGADKVPLPPKALPINSVVKTVTGTIGAKLLNAHFNIDTSWSKPLFFNPHPTTDTCAVKASLSTTNRHQPSVLLPLDTMKAPQDMTPMRNEGEWPPYISIATPSNGNESIGAHYSDTTSTKKRKLGFQADYPLVIPSSGTTFTEHGATGATVLLVFLPALQPSRL